MAYSFTEKKRIRKNFGKRPVVLDAPYLLAIQLDSYRKFLQLNISAKVLPGIRQSLFHESVPCKPSRNLHASTAHFHELCYSIEQNDLGAFDKDGPQVVKEILDTLMLIWLICGTFLFQQLSVKLWLVHRSFTLKSIPQGWPSLVG